LVEEVLNTLTMKDVGVVVVAAITTYFVARDAQRTAKAANRRIDRLIDGTNGRPGILDRLTTLEEGRKTDRVELLRVRDTAHSTVGSLGAIVGFTDHAIDIVGDAIGKELPHPKLILPKRAGDDQGGPGA
jgi:hypothetical protein